MLSHLYSFLHLVFTSSHRNNSPPSSSLLNLPSVLLFFKILPSWVLILLPVLDSFGLFQLCVLMGSCFSARIKAESPIHQGSSPRYTGRGRNEMSGASSRVSSTTVPSTPRTQGEILQSPNLKNFTFNDLKAATRNFRPDSVLGEGGFGCVFKGWVDENSLTAARPGTGMVIAVKRLNQEGFQGHQEWLAEINYLGQLDHPNLVKLIGYCLEDDHRLLVYEFLPKGSLENHLFRRASYFQPLSWNVRMKISLDAAKGLAFLHSPKAKVIYRDFKASNILLDSNYNAKLSDFGLAKDGPTDSKSHVSTRVMGTYGYAAPEYMATGHLTARSDVYSFGVVLLEMLSGRRAIDKNRPSREQNLVEWARPYLSSKRRIFQVLDARLEGQYTVNSALKAASIAVKCLSIEPKYRPTMEEVVKELESLNDSTDNEGSRHSKSEPLPKVNHYSSSGLKHQSQRKNTKEAGNGHAASRPRPSPSPLHS